MENTEFELEKTYEVLAPFLSILFSFISERKGIFFFFFLAPEGLSFLPYWLKQDPLKFSWNCICKISPIGKVSLKSKLSSFELLQHSQLLGYPF